MATMASMVLLSAPPTWREIAGFLISSVALLLIGVALGMIYCDYRRVHEVQQLTQALAIGQQCINTLGEVVPAAIILARQERRSIVVTTPARDSLRERRWTSP